MADPMDTAMTQPQCRHCLCGAHTGEPHTAALTKGVPPDMHACGAINDLSSYIVVIYKTWGKRAWTGRLVSFLAQHY